MPDMCQKAQFGAADADTSDAVLPWPEHVPDSYDAARTLQPPDMKL